MTVNNINIYFAKCYSEGELKKWFYPLGLVFFEDKIIISFPHKYFADWFMLEYRILFESSLQECIEENVKLEYQVSKINSVKRVMDLQKPVSRVKKITFVDCLINKKNTYPWAVAKNLVEQCGNAANPLTICGEYGSGKSYMLRALKGEFEQKFTRDEVCYLSVEQWRAQIDGNEVRAKEIRSKICNAKVFLLDDLQDLQSNEDLQSDLIYIIDLFQQNEKVIAFACLGSLVHYSYLITRLRSRLESGLVVSLKPADMDFRIQYIQRFAENNDLNLSPERVLLLAQVFQNLSSLHGGLTKLKSYMEIMGTQLSEHDIRQVLDSLYEEIPNNLTSEQIMQLVSQELEVGIEDILSTKRNREIVNARQISMFLCRKHLNISYSELGRIFGGKDHASVLYSCNKIKSEIEKKPYLKKTIGVLSDRCMTL